MNRRGALPEPSGPIAELLVAAARAEGATHHDIARHTGYTSEAVRRAMSGQLVPGWRFFRFAADWLHVDPDERDALRALCREGHGHRREPVRAAEDRYYGTGLNDAGKDAWAHARKAAATAAPPEQYQEEGSAAARPHSPLPFEAMPPLTGLLPFEPLPLLDEDAPLPTVHEALDQAAAGIANAYGALRRQAHERLSFEDVLAWAKRGDYSGPQCRQLVRELLDEEGSW